jgi:hypothetical protein
VLVANAGFGGINHAVCIGGHPPSDTTLSAVHTAAAVSDLAVAGRLPTLSAREILGRIDAGWGRLDSACRAVVATTLRLGQLEARCAQVLLTRSGCAASDRTFELGRRADTVDPQRFPYTLPSTPLGEASIRAGLRGPAFALLGASPALAALIADEMLADAPAVVVTHCESDQPPQRAEAALRHRSPA